jgi:hypothetical protein
MPVLSHDIYPTDDEGVILVLRIVSEGQNQPPGLLSTAFAPDTTQKNGTSGEHVTVPHRISWWILSLCRSEVSQILGSVSRMLPGKVVRDVATQSRPNTSLGPATVVRVLDVSSGRCE